MSNTRAVLLAAALAGSTAFVPGGATAALPSSTHSVAARLKIARGNCPAQVVVTTRAQAYEGGANVALRIEAENFVMVPVRGKRVARRVQFSAAIAPPFQTCEATARTTQDGTAYAFDWRDGDWHATVTPSAELQMIRLVTRDGNPTVQAAVAD